MAMVSLFPGYASWYEAVTHPFAQAEPATVFRLFDRTAGTYDRLNDLLSLGLHRLWKRQAVALLQPRPGRGS